MPKSKKDKNNYYEYLLINSLNVDFHLVNLENSQYFLLIPSNYIIDYSNSLNNYSGMGHVYFTKNNIKYVIDYMKRDNISFDYYLKDVKGILKRKFTNYRNQLFYEIEKNHNDFIYMLMNGYIFRVTNYNKMSMNEYFDMYFILYSITTLPIHEDLQLLKELLVLRNYAISSLCDNKDILLANLSDYVSAIDISHDDVILQDDNDYLQYKSKSARIDKISQNLIASKCNQKIFVEKENNEWLLNGALSFGCLGNFQNTSLVGFAEITESSKLSYEDKQELLSTIVKQKQIEIYSYETVIKEEFYKFLVKFLLDNFNYTLWNNYHFREYLNLNVINYNYDSLSDYDLYDCFYTYLSHVSSDLKLVNELFNYSKICESVCGEKLIIYPDHFVVTFSALNDLLYMNTFNISDQYYLNN